MTQSDERMQSFLTDFFATWLFQPLPDKLKSTIASQLRLCSFPPGAVIYPDKELPSDVHCVVQGSVRILGANAQQSPTLAVSGIGTIVGWDSLIRRVGAGSVRAAMTAQTVDRDVLTLALSADEFEAIALDYLMPTLMQVSALELFDTLSRALSHLSDSASELNLTEVAQYIDQEQFAVVKHWDATLPNALSFPLADDRIWLVSGGDVNSPIGTPITHVDQLQQPRPSRFPIRLLGIDRHCLTSTLQPAPPTQPNIAAIDPFIAKPPELSPPDDKSYSIWKSRSPELIEDIVACFGMVCDRLRVPYRPDSLRRTLKQQDLDRFEPVDLYVRIAEAIGLNAQVVYFTPTGGGMNRLATPALIPFGDVFAVLYDVSATTAVIGSPRTGLLRSPPDRLANRLTIDTPSNSQRETASCRAIVLERFLTTPTKRFGFHRFVPMVIKQKGILVQVLLASIVIQLLSLGNPLLVQQVIDNVIINSNAGAMSTFGTLMIAFALIEGVLTILRTQMLISTTNRMDLQLGVEIVRHLLHLPLKFFEQRPVGELASRLLELENIRQFMTETAITTVMDVVFSIFYIGVMFLYSTRLTLCVLATIPIVIVSTLLMSKIQQKLLRLKADQGAKVQSYMVEVLGGIASVKSQHMESLVEATWRDRYVQYLTSGFTTSNINTVFYSYSNFLNTVSSLLVLWVGAELVLKGELTLGGLIAFRILTGYVTGPLLRLARLWQRFQEASLSMELLADIVDAPAEEELSQEQQLQIPPIVGRVQYQEVCFGFKPGQLQLLNIQLDIAPGTFVGIVGQSGSGKSTLMKLLPRLYLPQKGSITIDNYDVGKVDLHSLRSQVGVVSQDAVLFQGTIRDNIALFENLPDEVVIEAARVAEAHDFIMQLPDGYGTQIGERGSALSGGQRQRIAIARVVIRNPRLLIFDEATSALDYETERRVCTNLMQRFQGRTCFFITHRLNTIARSDWILFMQSGIIAEQGKHQDLIARRQLYYCLYAQQSKEE
ncbi:MAG: ATP-binding cassette domain-containing protein [Leptolyngbyaceae cyanobacterium CSU_1_3]|nr:ATP-binding cassette domain-containing protein [Leptolyngbyaceae cyanobacterium CSU_1_3]